MEKLYSEKQIYISTFFGGPIPPGILIYKNFKRIGEDDKASKTLMLTFLFTVLLFFGLMQLPDQITDKLPNILFTSLYTGIVYLVYHKYLAKKINANILEPENKASNWNVAGLTTLGFVLNLIIIFLIAVSEPAFPGDRIEYGEMKHEIFYDKGDIENSNLQIIGGILTEVGYFTNELQQAVRVERENEKYWLNIPFQNSYWENPALIAELENLKNILTLRTGLNIKLKLIHYDITGKTLYKEI